MAFQPEVNSYDAGVYQIETTDPVQGGVGGLSNSPLLSLANRTKYLKAQVDTINASLASMATTASPALTGTPTTPTPAAGDNSTTIANTAFVDGLVNGAATVNVAGGANVVLTAAQYGVGIVLLTGAITANINVVFPTQSGRWFVVNNTTGAFSITCKTAGGTGVTVNQGNARPVICDGTNVIAALSDFSAVALGTASTAVTQANADNSTKVATTAFVQALIATVASSPFGGQSTLAAAATTNLGSASSRLVQVTGNTGITSFGSSALTTNPIFFVQFTGTPTITYNATSMILPGGANITAANGDSLIAEYLGSGNWQVLAYFPGNAKVLAAALASNAVAQAGTDTTLAVTPAALASVLSAGGYAKLASPALTGTPTTPTAAAGTNTAQVASCAFVQTAFTIATSFFESGEQSLSNPGTIVLAHGMASKAVRFQVFMRCKTAEFGYSVGDEIENTTDESASVRGVFGGIRGATEVLLIVGDQGQFVLPNASTGHVQTITKANWVCFIRAWAT